MTPDEFRNITSVSRETVEKIRVYESLIQKWQPKINLVSRNTMNELWSRHFLDSWQLVQHIRPTDKILVDLGSGGGFPAIILAIITDLEVHMVESDRRKSLFLKEVVRTLGLNAHVHNDRIENIESLQADIVTSRALAPLTDLLKYAQNLMKNDGICIFPKGKRFKEELTDANYVWHIIGEEFKSIVSDDSWIFVVKEFSDVCPDARSRNER